MFDEMLDEDKYFLIKLYDKLFRIFQKFGFHIIPNHYYFPIPDTRALKDELWVQPQEMVGININDEMQTNLLSDFHSKFNKEYDKFPEKQTNIPYKYFIDNHLFSSVDGEIYYCMIRHFKPKKIIEVGGGYSTYLAAEAILKNKEKNGKESELIIIDPYPNKILQKGFPGLSKVIKSKVEDVNYSLYKELGENDILFIDSSHVLKMGNDVQYLYLEVLPRLNKGVLIHIHDIYLPQHYPKEWLIKEYRFWDEQYLLQMFLTYNNEFEIVMCNNYLHQKHQDLLINMFKTYESSKILPSSFWIRRKRAIV
jgi:hypothetical protein